MMILEYPSHGSSLRYARWLFPLYLVLINLFVAPIAMIGVQLFDGVEMSPDLFVLAIPMAQQMELTTILALLGGFSAATAMILVTSFALSTMITNEVMVPIALHMSDKKTQAFDAKRLLMLRRGAIILILIAAYLGYLWLGADRALAQIGLVSFAGITQFAPALIFGVLWPKASRDAVLTGLGLGLGSWVLLVMLPELGLMSYKDEPLQFIAPIISLVMPGDNHFIHGSVFSLALNISAIILVTLTGRIDEQERLQTVRFLDPLRAARRSLEREAVGGSIKVTLADLHSLLDPYLGHNQVMRAFRAYQIREGLGEVEKDVPLPIGMIREAERLLAGVLGVASARLVMGMTLEKSRLDVDHVMSLLDDANEAIKYSRAVLEATIENVAQGVGVFDQELNLICRNERFIERLRLPPRLATLGTPLASILRYLAESRDFGPGSVEQIVNDRIASYKRQEEERFVRERPDGTVLEIVTRPITGLGVVASYHDITEQVRAERTLKLTNAILEKRVQERTRELQTTNEALRLAQRQAEEANRSKTRFLAAASHDLLQPLNAARLFVSSLSEQNIEEKDKDLLRRAEASLSAVDDLLNTLLDITRLDAGAMPVILRDFCVSDILAPLASEFQVLAERKGLTLTYVPCHETIRSDPKLLRRVVANFLANAVRYTQSGRILLGCRRRAGSIYIQVGDTGVGIAEDRLQEVFKEFRRLEPAEKLAHGLGLGLAIVRRIANALNHEIKIASVVHRGTMMTIVAPRVASHPRKLLEPSQEFSKKTGTLDGLCVMVVDDEPDIRRAMAALLEKWGCKVVLCSSLDDVREHLRTVKPDMVVADYFLSAKYDGIDVIGQIKNQIHDVRSILVTADRSEGVRAKAERASLQVLYKPVRPAALRALMMHLVRQ